jgi:hypothetical protein
MQLYTLFLILSYVNKCWGVAIDNAVSILVFIDRLLDEIWMLNCNGFRRKQSWSNWDSILHGRTEESHESQDFSWQDSWCLGQDMNCSDCCFVGFSLVCPSWCLENILIRPWVLLYHSQFIYHPTIKCHIIFIQKA